jgi:outer membrane translocation and assembly module TamA
VYLRVSERAVLAARVRVGVGGPGPLPAPVRFFGGGAESHRGFVRQRLSPVVVGSGRAVPVGGDAAYEASVELRVELPRVLDAPLGAAVFVDVGDAVQGGLRGLARHPPHLAVGPGLRYLTPVGALRLDVGCRINRLDPGAHGLLDRLLLHLSLGEAF